ncbi:hypothetical protein [Dongia sedimenti]|uniref:Uncharacterized protein n=1 Tax=Dongia sedimenti TaxID=3064282 RepID=A0ABU0YND5_9PROT|nr:hypothetical protein [Rhodospirillaceae bacterium R-7]
MRIFDRRPIAVHAIADRHHSRAGVLWRQVEAIPGETANRHMNARRAQRFGDRHHSATGVAGRRIGEQVPGLVQQSGDTMKFRRT